MSNDINKMLKQRAQEQERLAFQAKVAASASVHSQLPILTKRAVDILRQLNYPLRNYDQVHFTFITERTVDDTAAWWMFGETDSGFACPTNVYVTADGRLVYFNRKSPKGSFKLFEDYLRGISSISRDLEVEEVFKILTIFVRQLEDSLERANRKR